MKNPLIQKSLNGVIFGVAMVFMASAGCMTKSQSSSTPPAPSQQSAAAMQEQERQKNVDRTARELFKPLSGKTNDNGQ